MLPSLLYASESWTLYRRQIKELEKFHQRQLQKILSIKWDDYISNEKELATAGLSRIETAREEKSAPENHTAWRA